MPKEEKSYPLLLQWMRKQEIDDKMIWKKAAEHQEIFVRDDLCASLLHTPVFVVSTHCSKSIELPVYRFMLHNGIIVTARENFYGWVVSIKSPFMVDLPEDLVYGDEEDGKNGDVVDCYCEGFKSDWVYPYGTKEVRLSTFRVSDNFRLWALMRELKKYPGNEKEVTKFGSYLVKICAEQTMALFPDMELYNVFQFTHCYVYGYKFCKKDGRDLPTFFHCADKDISKEEELKLKIEDFAKRVEMDEEAQRRFDAEIRCFYEARIEPDRLKL